MIPSPRSAYVEASVTTASPARLLLMLCERLVLDCRRGLEAQQAGLHEEAHAQLLHAQDIVAELHSSLRMDVWDGATGLAALYGHLQAQLVLANVRRDPEITSHCLALVADLTDTWREAALQTAAVGA